MKGQGDHEGSGDHERSGGGPVNLDTRCTKYPSDLVTDHGLQPIADLPPAFCLDLFSVTLRSAVCFLCSDGRTGHFEESDRQPGQFSSKRPSPVS